LNPLCLSGFGVSLTVDGARLIVKDGFLEPDSAQATHEFQPRRMPHDSIVRWPDWHDIAHRDQVAHATQYSAVHSRL